MKASVKMLPIVAVCLLAASASAIRFPSDREKIKEWAKRTMVRQLEEATPAGLDLAHVSAIYRHGDRSPTSAIPGDKTTEEFWTFGGGGWGELSPIGMRQLYMLGKKLYDRYADGVKFLSDTYKAREMFVHCTDKNRTVVSAMSNLAGMYSRPKAQANNDYPDVDGWPDFFIPIPIHTEFGGLDHIGDPESKCPRQDALWKLVHQTDDYKKAAEGDYTVQTLEYLRDAIGVADSAITFDNIYKIWDNMLIENIWYPDNVTEWYPYYTKEISEKVNTIYDWGVDLINGILVDNMMNGIDLSAEIATIRGGPLLNDIMAKARGVIHCRLRDTYGQANDCKDTDHFYRNLKFHVVSGHDTTLGAYLTVLGAKTMVIPDGGYPVYSAAILTEFYIDRRSGGTDEVFRILYHDSENTDFRVITPYVEGCTDDFCPVEVLEKLAAKYAPPGGIDVFCQQRIAL